MAVDYASGETRTVVTSFANPDSLTLRMLFQNDQC